MICSDKTLCEMMLRMLDRPEYAHWAGKRKEIGDIRDLLSLSPPDEESPLLSDFLARNRRFWSAVTVDLNWDVHALVTERAAQFTAIRQHRPLNAEERADGARINDLFSTILAFNKKGQARGHSR